MDDITKILSQIEEGDGQAAQKLLPLVYDELRRLAAAKMAQETPEQTLQATALVHEAYIRLVDVDKVQRWDSRGHFFAAAAEAMRRILVDAARRKRSLRRGGTGHRRDLLDGDITVEPVSDELLDIDEALNRLAKVEPQTAELVKLRVFAGMTVEEAANATGMSPRAAKRDWAYGRAWLQREIDDDGSSQAHI
jgi:RNA polymerase sigma factor (TIGR02999 family)